MTAARRRARVLFVDDEPAILSSIERLFRREPYDCHFTNEPERAASLVASLDIDVVVTDQRMPIVTGEELLLAVAAQHPRTVGILASAGADRAIAARVGALFFVEKPWETKELQRSIRLAIDHALESLGKESK